tara:strand:- start:41 stop:223 length:183 start_codon:yes stop_codon:yes gene_type:complete
VETRIFGVVKVIRRVNFESQCLKRLFLHVVGEELEHATNAGGQPCSAESSAFESASVLAV